MMCPIIFNGNTIELTVHTSCYLGLRLTLCYLFSGHRTMGYLLRVRQHEPGQHDLEHSTGKQLQYTQPFVKVVQLLDFVLFLTNWGYLCYG